MECFTVENIATGHQLLYISGPDDHFWRSRNSSFTVVPRSFQASWSWQCQTPTNLPLKPKKFLPFCREEQSLKWTSGSTQYSVLFSSYTMASVQFLISQDRSFKTFPFYRRSNVIPAGQPQDWVTFVDQHDAYFYIPITPENTSDKRCISYEVCLPRTGTPVQSYHSELSKRFQGTMAVLWHSSCFC